MEQSKSIRIALINPPNTTLQIESQENAPPPLGLAYIASKLRCDGFKADLFDLADKSEISIESLSNLGFFSYDLYGFTAYTKTIQKALELAALTKRKQPKCTVVFGGPHADPSAAGMLEDYAFIDYVIAGEGEHSMSQLAASIDSSLSKRTHICGLSYRKSDSIIQNPRCTHQKHLDDLPFPVLDYKLEPERQCLVTSRGNSVEATFICTSRGCPKRCTFCSIVVVAPQYRFRSVQSILLELAYRKKHESFQHISIIDANFLANANRAKEFAEALFDWNPTLTWSATATVDSICKNPSIIDVIGQLNCVRLEVGIESGSQSVLRRFNKETTVDQNLEAIQMLRTSGIDLDLDFIMFDPETTIAELIENYQFIVNADLLGYVPFDHLHNELKIYPGTPARSHYVQKYSLKEHHLMPLIVPFANPKTNEIYQLVKSFFAVFEAPIREALSLVDEKLKLLDTSKHSKTELLQFQRDFETGIQLRHAPYKFFENLLFKDEHENSRIEEKIRNKIKEITVPDNSHEVLTN